MHIKRNIFYVKLFYPSFLHLFSKIQCWTKKYVKSLPLFVACYLRDMRIFNESVRRCFCVTKKGKRLMITCYWDEMIQIEPVSPRIECQGPGLVSSLPHGAQREVRNLGEESRVGISCAAVAVVWLTIILYRLGYYYAPSTLRTGRNYFPLIVT